MVYTSAYSRQQMAKYCAENPDALWCNMKFRLAFVVIIFAIIFGWYFYKTHKQ